MGVATTAVRFHHISLSVADLSAQEAWYGDALGLTQVEERLEMPEAGVRTAVLSDATGLRVEFVERPGSSPVSHADPFAATALQTFTHLALHVPDLDAAFRRLTVECGAAPVSSPAPGVTEGMRYAYIADPEGNLLELIETSGV
ncbi:VOC family protein [Streptomyces sp. NPDC094472]|uniref:VOC family protein n=1 Tax=unclassified Streptomyces TaxID=2593676 RepID=UPI00332C6263